MRPMTKRLFADAGISAGMRVVDLGSGAGDVCMLLAEMVGPSGAVIGIDLDQEATLHAQNRVVAAGLENVEFVHSDFEHYTPDAPIDAIVGRAVAPWHGKSPPASVATTARESVSSIAYVPPCSTTHLSSKASMRRAAPVIKEAIGGKQYAPGSSGWATRHLKGSASIPWHVTRVLRSDSKRCISA